VPDRRKNCYSILSVIAMITALIPARCEARGAAPKPVKLSPASLKFSSTPIGTSASNAITLTNPNGSAVSVVYAVVGDFRVSKDTCSGSVPASSNCQLTITYTPACPVGSHAGALLLTLNGAKPRKVGLSGIAAANSGSTGHQVLVAGGVTNGSLLLQSADLFDPARCTFTPTGNMTVARGFHTGTFLDPAVVSGSEAGMILITGGQIDPFGDITNSAELFDPSSGTFIATGSMSFARAEHTATLMTSGPLKGRVVVIGGEASGLATNTAEVYDPSSGTFTLTSGNMNMPRSEHTATLITCSGCSTSGDILVTGGYEKDDGIRGDSIPNDTAELFDPSSQTFTCVGGAGTTFPCADVMSSRRWEHEADSLIGANGSVLVLGGANEDNFFFPGTATNTTDIFDNATSSMKPGPKMADGRNGGAVAMLANGDLIMTGGNNAAGKLTVATAELFDPAGALLGCVGGKTGSKCRNSMTSPRASHEATTLISGGASGGEVLLTGGIDLQTNRVLNSAEIFDPATMTFQKLPNMHASRNEHIAIQF
jgi:hypothetical protein